MHAFSFLFLLINIDLATAHAKAVGLVGGDWTLVLTGISLATGRGRHSFLILTSAAVAACSSHEIGDLRSDKYGPHSTPEIASFVSLSTTTDSDARQSPLPVVTFHLIFVPHFDLFYFFQYLRKSGARSSGRWQATD